MDRKALNEYSSQYMDTFESPQEDYTRSDEFKAEFYNNLKRCLKERDYFIVTQVINGSSYEQIGEKLGLSSQNIKNKFNDCIKRLSQNRHFKDMISTLLRGDYTAKNVGKINADARKRWEKKKRQQQLEKLSQDEWFNELKNKNYEYAKEYAYYKYGIKLETKNMNKKLIRLTESDLHRIVKESVNRVMKEGVEFSSEDPQEEWMYYQNKLQQEFDELGIMVLNKIPRNDPDRQIIQRYIRMIQTHLHTLEN